MAQARAPMPASRRAKQFSMFDALKGFKEALAAKERQPEPRRELAQDAIEELNRTICTLHPGDIATVIYYCQLKKESIQLSGQISKIDPLRGSLRIGVTCVQFIDIGEIRVERSF